MGRTGTSFIFWAGTAYSVGMAMSMGQDEDASLSNELEELIRIHFDPQVQPAVRATLLSYAAARPGPVMDRVQFDLLHLSAGNVDRLKRLAELAAQDPRDVMSQEYFWVAGRSYPHTWARRHAVNRNWDEPPKQDQEGSALI